MQPELESWDNPEVAAPAPECPEQVGMRIGVRAQKRAVGRYDVGRQQAVDGQAVLADEVADASPEREPADPDRAGIPEGVARPCSAAAAV